MSFIRRDQRHKVDQIAVGVRFIGCAAESGHIRLGPRRTGLRCKHGSANIPAMTPSFAATGPER